MDSEVEVYRAPVRVAGRNGGHRQGWWSQAGLLVAGRADSGRQGWWSQAGMVVTGRAGGGRQGCPAGRAGSAFTQRKAIR